MPETMHCRPNALAPSAMIGVLHRQRVCGDLLGAGQSAVHIVERLDAAANSEGDVHHLRLTPMPMSMGRRSADAVMS